MIAVNKVGADWLELRRYIKIEIKRLRDELEQQGVHGDFQRGQIGALRKLIAEVEPDVQMTTEDEDYT